MVGPAARRGLASGVMPMQQASDPRAQSRVPGDVVFVGVVGMVTNARDVDQAEGAHGHFSVAARACALKTERR